MYSRRTRKTDRFRVQDHFRNQCKCRVGFARRPFRNLKPVQTRSENAHDGRKRLLDENGSGRTKRIGFVEIKCTVCIVRTTVDTLNSSDCGCDDCDVAHRSEADWAGGKLIFRFLRRFSRTNVIQLVTIGRQRWRGQPVDSDDAAAGQRIADNEKRKGREKAIGYIELERVM